MTAQAQASIILYIYQIIYLPVKKNSCKTAPTTSSLIQNDHRQANDQLTNSQAGISHLHYTEILLPTWSPIISKSHWDCNNFLATPASCLTKNAKKVEYLCREAAFSYYFGTPRALPSIRELGFYQRYTSSRPRGYCQKMQSPDSVNDFSKEYLRHSHSCHLKYNITGMPDHLGSDLDQLLTERS